MKITIEAESKEIADIVLAVQDQLKKEELFSPKDLLTDSINAVLHEKSHDTSEEKTVELELFSKNSPSTLPEAIRSMREAGTDNRI